MKIGVHPIKGEFILAGYVPVDFIVYFLQKYTKQGDLVLDAGCGAALYRKSIKGRYVGIDISTDPYGENCPRDVDVVASGVEVPFCGSVFDLVFSVSAFFQFPDPAGALCEYNRILKPGGRLILFDYNRRIQKKLEIREKMKRPCWTQWGLKKLVIQAGFRDCELLLPFPREIHGIERLLRLLEEEMRGQWAIVTGVK